MLIYESFFKEVQGDLQDGKNVRTAKLCRCYMTPENYLYFEEIKWSRGPLFTNNPSYENSFERSRLFTEDEFFSEMLDPSSGRMELFQFNHLCNLREAIKKYRTKS